MAPKIVFHEMKMEIPVKNGLIVHSYGELMYIIYDEPFCRLYFKDNVKYRVEVSLQYMLENLPKGVFFKCNRSTILNICYYKEYKKKPLMVIMEDGKELVLSRRVETLFHTIKRHLPRITPPCPGCYSCTCKDCKAKDLFCRRTNNYTVRRVK